MTPRELVRTWVDAFNAQDVETLAGFYAEDVLNQKVAEWPVVGGGTAFQRGYRKKLSFLRTQGQPLPDRA